MFASCWSAVDEESIPQWAMYGDTMKGVRISLRTDPFIWHPIDIRWHENFQFIDLEAPFSVEEMLGSNITLIPTPRMRSTFGQPVRCVQDVPLAIESLYTAKNSDEIKLFGEGNEIAFFKPNNWAFQQEHRFVLVAAPGPAKAYQGDPAAYIQSRKEWHSNGVNFMTDISNRLHVDLRLDPAALNCAEITVGPLAPAGTFEIVESLLASYAEGATVRRSILSNTIRSR